MIEITLGIITGLVIYLLGCYILEPLEKKRKQKLEKALKDFIDS